MEHTELIEIRKREKSRISEVDFSNLPFGKIFSDHVFSADYVGGNWQNLQITPYEQIDFFPALITLHYGQAIFEGLKAYRNVNEEIVLFRPDQNASRFTKSAERLCMPPFPEDLFVEAITRLVELDAEWVPSPKDGSLYIRPHMFATDQYIGVHPSSTYKFFIFTCPSGPYFAKPVKVKMEMTYSRACEGGIGNAKAAANYAAALYPTKIAMEEGFDQVIWTDSKDHQFIEEAGTMNVFFRIGDELLTPAGDTILDGITRKSVLQLAEDLGISATARKVSVQEVIEAAKKGTLLDAFGAGTAAVISTIQEIGYKGERFTLPMTEEALSFSKAIGVAMENIKSGAAKDVHGWVKKVS